MKAFSPRFRIANFPESMRALAAQRSYPQELRERALRLAEDTPEGESGVIVDVALIRVEQRTGINTDTLRGWVTQAAINARQREELLRTMQK